MGVLVFMSTLYNSHYSIIRNKTSCAHDFEFTRFDCISEYHVQPHLIDFCYAREFCKTAFLIREA